MKIKSGYWHGFRPVLFLPIFVAIVSSFSKSLVKIDCSETIEINGVAYPVPERWCGKKLDKSQLASSKKLAKVPSKMSFENYRIYVTPETKQALLKMTESAKKSGLDLIVDSGFRSIWYQKLIIQKRLVQGEKYEKLITFVAPPGYSEHHTGRAVDFVPSEARFAYSSTYKWLVENAASFGFYQTYPEDTTGFVPWESWHWVYIPD